MPMSMHDRIREWILGIVHENTTQGVLSLLDSGFECGNQYLLSVDCSARFFKQASFAYRA